MRWEEFEWDPARIKLRQFGMLLVLLGAGIAIAGLTKGTTGLAWYICPLALVLGGLFGIFTPGVLRWPFVIWTLAVFPIGWTISHLILLGIFLFLFLPIGLVFRILRRDALNLGLSNKPSFWNTATTKMDSNRYFRQY